MTSRSIVPCMLLMACQLGVAHAEPARGSITIERIADIKYPTNPTWSPDGTRVAFLWDAAGKQDLFVVTPGQKPVQLTDFPVDPNLLVSDIGAVAWTSNSELLFGKDGQLWSVTVTAPTPARVSGPRADAGVFMLSPDRAQLAFLRRGQIWMGNVAARTERQLTNVADGLTPGVPVFSPDGRWLAFTASRGGLEPEDLPWNGPLVRSMQRTDVENSLDLYAVAARAGAAPVRLSDSMPVGLNKTDLVAPTFVSFPSRLDKAPVLAPTRTSSAGTRAATGCTTR